MAFTYGLSQLDIGTGGGNAALALSTPDAVPPEHGFRRHGLRLQRQQGRQGAAESCPSGLTLAPARRPKKTVEEGGKRSAVFWQVHAGAAGVYTDRGDERRLEDQPHDVVVKKQRHLRVMDTR